MQSPFPGWNANPIIYEINTWVWLRELSAKLQREITLANVPEEEIESLAAWGFDAVWLMGIWHRGRATRQSALNYLHEYQATLPRATEADVEGSAYAIHAYRVEEQIGGRRGLAILRERLAMRGIKLVLDFVPNHCATDHRWIHDHPDFFIQGPPSLAQANPEDYFLAETVHGPLSVARGRDPYFPAWIDTAQHNAFNQDLRQSLIKTLIDIGRQCDGLRCDMAMLMMNDIFAATWGGRAGTPPALDFWQEIIPAVRAVHPQMLFMAEVYWGRERALQAQGFDFTYDKGLYDALLNTDIAAIKSHIAADSAASNIRFIENHDEARAMSVLGQDRQRTAATLICALPGAVLLHEGQLSGRRVKLPAQITRRPDEAADLLLEAFYRDLLREATRDIYRRGHWQTIEITPAPGHEASCDALIACAWSFENELRLIAINFGGHWSRCHVSLPQRASTQSACLELHDVLSGATFSKSIDAENDYRIQLDVPPQCAHIFRVDPMQ